MAEIGGDKQYINNLIGKLPEVNLSQLFDLCKHGDLDSVRDLIERGSDPYARDSKLATPLHYACQHGHINIVRYYIMELQCDPNVKDVLQATPLHHACEHGHTDIVRYFISEIKCNSNTKDIFEGTLIHYACRGGHIDIIHYLIEEVGLEPFVRDAIQQPPLQWAISRNHVAVINYFVKEYYRTTIGTCCTLGYTEIISSQTLIRESDLFVVQVTPLHAACSDGQLEVVQYLVEKVGMDPALKCSNITPLRNACCGGHLNIVQYLLNKKVYDHITITNETQIACYKGIASVVDHLIKWGCTNPNTEDCCKNNLMQYAICGCKSQAAVSNTINVMDILISTAKCDINKANCFGDTALHTACQKNLCFLVRYLLSKSCDPSIINAAGKTALWATCYPDIVVEFMKYTPADVCRRILADDIDELVGLELLQCLLQQHNLDPNEDTGNGDTALHLASEADKIEIVKYLLSVEDPRCNPIAVNEYGQIPLEVTSSPMIVREFIQHGVCGIELLKNLIIDERQIFKLVTEISVCSTDGNDLPIVNTNGDNALHLACNANRPTVVKYLLQDSKIYWNVNSENKGGETAIQLTNDAEIIRELIRRGARPADVYSYNKRILKTCQPPEITVKVFVIGDTGAGKSTLIGALKREEWFWLHIFEYIEHLFQSSSSSDQLTAGVLPQDFQSNYYGKVTWYDYIGDKDFHQSFSELLKNTLDSPRVFLIVINLNNDEEEVLKKLKYWLSFLEETPSKTKLSTIVVGSKYDLCVKNMDLARKVAKYARDRAQKSHYLDFFGFTTVNCQYSSSLKELRNCLQSSCNNLRVPRTIPFNAHCFQVFLLDKFRDSAVVTVKRIQETIHQEIGTTSRDDDDLLHFLPYDSLNQLLKLCSELHNNSHIVFLNHIEPENSYVVINKKVLLSEIKNAIYSEDFKQLTTNTGLVPVNAITELFQQVYDGEMLIQFLAHLEFCIKASAKEAPLEEGSDLATEFYFFPALLKHTNAPHDIWQPSDESSYSYWWGWTLQCTKSEQFFNAQFLTSLLLRLAYYFSKEGECDSYDKKCTKWKNGIFWATGFGANNLVEVLPDNKAVIFLMRCRGTTNIAECIEQRSLVINSIKQCANEICPRVKTSEAFISPLSVRQYPHPNLANYLLDANLFEIQAVFKAAIDPQEHYIVSNRGNILVKDLLAFEPYAQLKLSSIQELCHEGSRTSKLDDFFLLNFSLQVSENQVFMKVINLILKRASPDHKECHHGYNLLQSLKNWRNQCDVTYQHLRENLDKFSIFEENSILVSRLLYH